jgi:hypothetical protein
MAVFPDSFVTPRTTQTAGAQHDPILAREVRGRSHNLCSLETATTMDEGAFGNALGFHKRLTCSISCRGGRLSRRRFLTTLN